MTLRIIRFIECQLDGNWAFDKGRSQQKSTTVTLSSWIKARGDRVISARIEGAKIGVSVSDNHGITIKFRKGAVVSIINDLLTYDLADAL